MIGLQFISWRGFPSGLALALGCVFVAAPLSGAWGQAAPTAAATPDPVAIKARSAAELFVHPRREASAAVIARNESRIAAEVGARILRIHADVGQTVRRGAVLAELDDGDLRLALAGLQAQRDELVARSALAGQQLRRAQQLQQQNYVSAEFVGQRDAEVQVLAAQTQGVATQLASARRQIDKARITAPFDAVVLQRSAQLGELAVPGAVLFVLTETARSELSAALAGTDASLIARAPSLTFETGAGSYPVRLLRVAAVVAAATRTREGRFAFVGDSALPGTAGTLRWDDPRPHLPPEVLVRRDGRLGVFALVDGTAHFVAVPLAQEGRAAAATIAAATRIVVSGQESLQDGQRVTTAR